MIFLIRNSHFDLYYLYSNTILSHYIRCIFLSINEQIPKSAQKLWLIVHVTRTLIRLIFFMSACDRLNSAVFLICSFIVFYVKFLQYYKYPVFLQGILRIYEKNYDKIAGGRLEPVTSRVWTWRATICSISQIGMGGFEPRSLRRESSTALLYPLSYIPIADARQGHQTSHAFW